MFRALAAALCIAATAGVLFAELKQRALINPATQAAGDTPDFSLRIRRQDRPGF